MNSLACNAGRHNLCSGTWQVFVEKPEPANEIKAPCECSCHREET